MSWPECPQCGNTHTKCTDSRPVVFMDGSAPVVRRRYCCKRKHRWSTVEHMAELEVARDKQVIEFNGKKRTIEEWARRIGISSNAMLNRLFVARWPVSLALTAKPMRRTRRLRIIT